ncbi:PREDICTED: IQ motif and SEC7 domain-containing protein 1-like, partial [Priapulus caudatus]|uniref:IQ motif and SEC7 domain-containing protein 1-like n=1 Tax=Priapulus caudatus TaxID=37621 RepID=A0ABM1EYY0_PRICU
MVGLSSSAGNTPSSSPLMPPGGAHLRANNWTYVNGGGRIKRSQTLSGTYELSDDLQAKQSVSFVGHQVEILERKYGGHLRARLAARVIQRAYRRHTMARQFRSMRAAKHDRRQSRRFYSMQEPIASSASASATAQPPGSAAVALETWYSESAFVRTESRHTVRVLERSELVLLPSTARGRRRYDHATAREEEEDGEEVDLRCKSMSLDRNMKLTGPAAWMTGGLLPAAREDSTSLLLTDSPRAKAGVYAIAIQGHGSETSADHTSQGLNGEQTIVRVEETVGGASFVRERGEERTSADHTSQVLKVEQTIVGSKKPKLAAPHRRLVCYCRLYEVPDPNKKEKPGLHQREIFLFNDIIVNTPCISEMSNVYFDSNRQFLAIQLNHANGLRLAQAVDGKTLITFNSKNEQDRAKFTEDLRESILEMNEDGSLRMRTSLQKHKMAVITRKEHAFQPRLRRRCRRGDATATTTKARRRSGLAGREKPGSG